MAGMTGRLLLAGALAVSAGSALAHHGWNSYDASEALTLTGSIAEANYENPHGTIRLQTGEKLWLVVLAPPFRMRNRGLPPEALTVGETAPVVGYAHKSEADELRAERIVIGGASVELR